ncbi:efflux RND transporter permease subunit [Luminiphilus sp. nBUS_07]|uniref:efflux RND transporter permease subunit n=1 Tax=Luminiphilus sp. nBUS_07 TaxID=3395314 RepID=UPI003EC0771B
MTLTRLAVENNRVTWVVLAVIILAGLQAFMNMPRAYDPGFIIRTAQVVTYFPGAAAERVEALVSSPIEEVVKELPELDFVQSESRSGVSIVSVNIRESYSAMRPIWDNLRRKIDSVADELPAGVSTPQVNDDFGDVYGIVVGLTGEGFTFSELDTISDEAKAVFLQLRDTAKVEILGVQEERVFVEYNNARLADLGLSPGLLTQILEERNIVVSGGSFKLGDERISLEPSGNFESIEEIGETLLRLPETNQLFQLRDVATLSRGYVDPPEELVSINGAPGIAIAIAMREGGNNIELGRAVKNAIADFYDTYPIGIEFKLVNFSPQEVEDKVKGFVANLMQAIGVVSLVMLATLGLRTGLVVSSLIPITMLLSIIVMSSLNIGLDQISLAALIIALGMLVDNGIVMSENIMVRMEKGQSSFEAALSSSAELRTPLLTASLTTAAAFLPIYLAESSVGEFTASLFKVVTITLLSSWVVSLTIIPLLCVLFLRVKADAGAAPSKMEGLYRRGLNGLLRYRTATLLLTAVVFVVALRGFEFVPKLFFPPSDRSYFTVEFESPTGTSIDKTQKIVAEVEQYLARLKADPNSDSAVRDWVTYVGSGGPRFVRSHNPVPPTPSFALMVVNTSSPGAIASIRRELEEFTEDRYPDLELKTRLIENGPAVDNPVEIRLSGTDSTALFNAVDAVKKQYQDVGGLRNISDDWGQRQKKIEVRINQARAVRVGITNQDIALSMQAGLTGIQLTEYREGEDVIPVVLRSKASTLHDINKVSSLSVYNQSSGQAVPLRQVADVKLVWDIAKVYRRDGVRTVAVGAQLEPGVTAADRMLLIGPWLEAQREIWGPSVGIELGGESESSGDANEAIGAKLPIAAFIILLLLVGQFNSLRKSVIILTTIPLGLIGVVASLLLGQSFFGFMTLLGVVSLAGIVINNAIVLLERIGLELAAGESHLDAILNAAGQRARPIILTTATTVLGLLPLYLGGGEMWEPMALAIMGGLLVSTVLTLGVIPVLYAALYGVRGRTAHG